MVLCGRQRLMGVYFGKKEEIPVNLYFNSACQAVREFWSFPEL